MQFQGPRHPFREQTSLEHTNKKNSFTSALPTIQSNLHAVLTFQFLQGSIHESIPRVHQALLKIQPFQSLAALIA